MSSLNGESDQNIHGKPFEYMSCLCTMEDITIEDKNYVEFQGYPSMKWKPALFEKCVVEQLLKEQFHQYIDRVQKSDCARELRRLLASGPPIYLSDEHGFPLTEGDTHIVNLWFASDKKERSAKLDGAKEGEEREELWNTLKDCYSEKKVSHDHNDQKEK